MEKGNTLKGKAFFPLFETAKPKFNPNQIRITNVKQKPKVALSKSCSKLKVGRTGKIGYSK